MRGSVWLPVVCERELEQSAAVLPLPMHCRGRALEESDFGASRSEGPGLEMGLGVGECLPLRYGSARVRVVLAPSEAVFMSRGPAFNI